MKIKMGIIMIILVIFITGCKQVDAGKGYIAGKPIPSAERKLTWQAHQSQEERLSKLKDFRDFSCADMSEIDFQSETEKYMLLHTIFDSRTKWSSKLPEGFKPDQLLETEKDAGWQIKEAHQRGIDGTGVNIGVIDAVFLMDHEAFGNQVQLYKQGKNMKSYEVGDWSTQDISKLIGKEIGIAPNAKLYFIADFPLVEQRDSEVVSFDVSCYGDDLRELLRVNSTLSKEDQLDMIVLPQFEYGDKTKNRSSVYTAIEEAEAQGIMVITNVINRTNKNYYLPITKAAYTKGEDLEDYKESMRQYQDISSNDHMPSIFMPMGGIVYATGTGIQDYEYNPVLNEDVSRFVRAGYYALARQCNPNLTMDEIDRIIYETSTTIELDDKTSMPIVDIITMIKEIQDASL